MSTMKQYYGLTYAFPQWLLPLWKYFMCRKNCHLFDEVVASGDQHYLVCDVCELIVNIENINDEWVKGKR